MADIKKITEILSYSKSNRIRLWVENESLAYEAPSGAMTAEFIRLLKENKQELIAFLSRNRSNLKTGEIERVEKQGFYELSNAQKRLWFLEEYLESSTVYNLPDSYILEGDFDEEAFQRAYSYMINRHESLRTMFMINNGNPVQKIVENGDFKIKVVDIRNEPDRLKRAELLAEEDIQTPFDLAELPLVRFSIIRLEDERSILLFNMHHIISDGWSMKLFQDELLGAYNSFKKGRTPDFEPLKIQYKDYSSWQNSLLASGELKSQRDYWLNKLGGELPILKLPADNTRPAVKSFNGASASSLLSPEILKGLKGIDIGIHSSLFAKLQALVKLLLHKYTGQDDIIVGSPIAGRVHEDLKNQIGFFVNTLALRDRVFSEDSFSTLLKSVTKSCKEALDNQEFPFDKLVEELNIKRDISRSPLFDVMLILQNNEEATTIADELSVKPYNEVTQELSKFDLTFEFVERVEGLSCKVEYNSDIYSAERIERVLKHIEILSKEVINYPDKRIAELTILPEEEKELLLERFNDTVADFPAEESVVTLFERQVEKRPDSVALSFDGGELTYEELNYRANIVAQHLIESYQVKADQLVGILLERSELMIIALWGVLKSGAAYLPIDPNYPEDRVNYILEDANPVVVLGDERGEGSDRSNMVDIRELLKSKARLENPARAAAPHNLAYVIYTSGSTGRPKGTLLEHRALVNRISWMQSCYPLDEGDTILQKTTYTFDVSLWELFWWGMYGAKLHLLPVGGEKDPALIVETIEQRAITTIHFVPSMYSIFLEHIESTGSIKRLKSLKQIFCSGEALTANHVARSEALCEANRTRLVNLYGPTEATIDVTYYNCEGGEEVVPIGRPISNITLYIVDEYNKLVPLGVDGELCISGIGLARAYLNRPELTAEKFVDNPYRPGEKMYKTGDLARWLPDGNILFLGRIDNQVKVRGFRIELGEIEAQLLKLDYISDPVVLAREDNEGNNFLSAYYTGKEESRDRQVEARYVKSWEKIYQKNYHEEDFVDNPFFAIKIWYSSYTNQPIDAGEMKEWVENSVANIRLLEPKKVYEIGCGSGLILYRVAPDCISYYGGDFSDEAVINVNQRVKSLENLRDKVEVDCRVADDFNGIAPESLDTIIINSVAQYFPNIEYLYNVIEKSVESLKAGGAVFLGDIRNYDLMEAFHCSINLFKAQADLPLGELKKMVRKSIEFEKELLVSPDFFYYIKDKIERVSHVEIKYKSGSANNELTRFRYDVVLHIEKEIESENIQEINWTEAGGELAEIERVLKEQAPDLLYVEGVINNRVERELLNLKLLNDSQAVNVADLHRLADGHERGGVDFQQFKKLGDCSYLVDCMWAGSGKDEYCDIVFIKREAFNERFNKIRIARNIKSDPARKMAAYANNPLKSDRISATRARVKEYLQGVMPDYMVPSYFVQLEEMPLSANGKIDRKTLPDPQSGRIETGVEYVAPRNELEERMSRIWGEVLDIDKPGIYDNFFELGGHSLKATRLISRISKAFEVNLALKEIFGSPTIEAICTVIEGAEKSEYRAIERVAEQDSYPLSHAQKRLWILDHFEQENTAYNMSELFILEGSFNREAFESSCSYMIERHESLRTIFIVKDGEPEQKVITVPAVEIESIDLSGDEEVEEMLKMIVERAIATPFNLQEGPLVTFTSIKLAAEKHLILFRMHHIISDGWSINIFTREFITVYNSFRAGKEPGMAPLLIQYKDYSAWQNRLLQSAAIAKQREYWLRKLAGEIPVLNLAGDRTRPLIKTFQGRRKEFSIERAVINSLKSFAKKEGASLFMLIQTLVKILLHRYTGQEDIIVGSPIAGRGDEALESQIGLYLNTIALRDSLKSDSTFLETLLEVKESCEEGFDNQDYPFDLLVDELNLKRDLSRSALFDVMVVLQDNESVPPQFDGLTIRPYEAESLVSKFDLTFDFTESLDGLHFTIEYNIDIFNEERVVGMGEHLKTLTSAVMKNPHLKISDYEIIPAEEKRLLTNEFNDTDAAYPTHKTVIDLFEEQVVKRPDEIAVIYEDIKLSYRELNEQANMIASYLREGCAVGENELVGIELDRSEKMIAAILGILKSGAAYVPIDPEYPADRIDYIINDAKMRVIICDRPVPEESCCNYLDINNIPALKCLGEERSYRPDPASSIYVIYTSGSTGKPKGTIVTHSNYLNYISWAMEAYFESEEGGNFPLFTSISFDLTTTSIFLPLLRGKTLYVFKQKEELSVILEEIFSNRKIDSVKLTPAHISILPELKLGKTAIERAIVGGEELLTGHTGILSSLNREMRIFNEYGPTEATVGCVVKEILEEDEKILIGKPIANMQMFVLNEELSLQPIGIPGELCIAGAGVTKGYLNRLELTNAKFVPNSLKDGELMYRTGDLVRWLSDGNLEFLGRIDSQVKIRGHRVEPGEIETTLVEVGGVKSAVVIAAGEEQKELIAYYTAEEELKVGELRASLKERLPDYMVPSYFIYMDEIPLTPNGKIDKKELPLPNYSQLRDTEYVAPDNPIEERLVEIWQNVLGVEQVGVSNNFFELGGNSLKAIKIVARVNKHFQISLLLKDLFVNPTIRGLAMSVKSALEPALKGSSQKRQGDDAQWSLEVKAIEKDEFYPLSHAQKRLWILDRLGEEGHTVYNMPGAFTIEGKLNEAAFQKAYHYLIERHESLRTLFESIEGEPVQKVVESPAFKIDIIDLRGERSSSERALELAAREAENTFDLAKGPLLRFKLIRVEEEKYILLFNMHHIISDGWSMDILTGELFRAYNSFSLGKIPDLVPLELHYKDYAAWQNSILESQALDGQKRYWHKRLSGKLPILKLPADRQRPARQSFKGNSKTILIESRVAKQLNELATGKRVSLFMMLQTLVKILLHKYSGQEDIIVGSPMAGRGHEELENQIGLYLNIIALRDTIKSEDSFLEALQLVKESCEEALDNQDYPFDLLVEELDIKRDMSRSPLFDVMLVLQQQSPTDLLELEGLKIAPYEVESSVSKYDLTFDFRESAEGIYCNIEYNSDIYNEDRVARMGEHLTTLIDSVIENPARKVSELRIVPEREMRLLTKSFNSNKEYSKDKTVVETFERQVEKSPERVALIFEDCEYTYRELNEKANLVAHYLRESYQIEPDELIGVQLDRSDRLIIAMLGILKAGGAYVPLDPAYPQARIDYMLNDCRPKVVLSESNAGVMVKLDDILEREGSLDNPEIKSLPSNLAYLIYTSGSTGNPKGVLVEHDAFVNMSLEQIKMFDIEESDRILQFASPSFDASLSEIFMALFSGSTLVIPGREVGYDPVQLEAFLIDRAISVATFTPSFLKKLKREVVANLRVLISAGERANPEDINYFSRFLKVINAYGPTEAAVCTSYYLVNDHKNNDSEIPIGEPIANTSVLIMDSFNNLVPYGVPGELCISGAGLARGYLNRPEITAEKFIEHPFIPGERVYRTGDLARWLADDNIEFLGRIDNQIKLRGFRIEAGEIENSLNGYRQIEAALITACETEDDNKELVAYYFSNEEYSSGELRSYLGRTLPGYMIPQHFVRVRELALTANGKIDRDALPDYKAGRADSGSEYITPESEIEQRLAAIWQDILGVKQIGLYDDFLELGGHSLKAIELVSRIELEFDIRVTIKELFENLSLANLATLISKGESDISSEGLLPIKPEGDKSPLFAVPGVWGHAVYYQDLADALDEEQPLYGLQAVGLDGSMAPLKRVEAIAERNIQAIKSIQKEGPYCLGGHSFGGQVAFEMALQLEKVGEEVELLLFDSYAPSVLELPPLDEKERLTNILKHIARQNSISLDYNIDSILEKGKDKHALAISRLLGAKGVNYSENLIRGTLDVQKANYEMRYSPQERLVSTRVTLFKSENGVAEEEIESDYGWSRYISSKIEVFSMPGDHDSILEKENVALIAEKIALKQKEK